MNRNLEEEAIFIRELANEVAVRCSSRNLVAPIELCVYLVDLKLLQLSKTVSSVASDWRLTEKVVEKCADDLTDDLPSIKTLKLQIFWREKYRSRDEIKKIHHETVFKNVVPIMTEILDGNLIKTVDKEDLYKKIVVFVIMFAGLGSPTHQSVVKETQAALQSIFKSTEMENFLSLGKVVKEQQLIEFARLVTGIRLFNKDCKKGGEGIDDLPLILREGVRATKERLLNFKDQLDKRIDRLAKALSQVYNLREAAESTDAVPPPSEVKKEVEDLKSLFVYFRQVELCLKDLLKDLEDSFVIVDELVERLQATLLQVHEVVRYRVAIATVQVFPLFLQLSNVWVEMQEEVDILSELNNNFVDLTLVAKMIHPTPLELSLGSDEVALVCGGGDINDDSFDFYPGVKICTFSSVSEEDCLQYEGFCAWTLAYTEGLLITGNISIGVLYFENRFYSFSSPEAAYKWAKDPESYIKTVLEVARSKPELIRFLNLYIDLETIVEEHSVAEEEECKPTMENAGVQTELHPLEPHVNREYTFSEWELKRRALRLATLTRCATKSQQTVKMSYFRKEMGTQVTSNVSRSTQTRREGSCNHPIIPRFIWGLKTHWREAPDSDSELGGLLAFRDKAMSQKGDIETRVLGIPLPFHPEGCRRVAHE